MQFFTTLATLIAAASAITVNQPAMNAVWTAGQDQTVSWTSVNTDASAVSVYLVNFSKYPTISQLIQANVATSAGSITVPGANITSTGAGFQVNLLAVTNPSQILAQSNQFSIAAGSASSAAAVATTSAAPTTLATTAAAATSSAVGATVSASGNTTVSNGTIPKSTSSTSAGSIAGVSIAALVFAGALSLF